MGGLGEVNSGFEIYGDGIEESWISFLKLAGMNDTTMVFDDDHR